jgi:hypothetical protein
VGGGAELRCFTTLRSKSCCEVAASGDAVLLDAEIRRHRHPEPHNPAVLCGGAVTGVTVLLVNLKVFIRLLPGWIHCTNWNNAAFISRWREVSAVGLRAADFESEMYSVTINSSDIIVYNVSLALPLGKIWVLLRRFKTKKFYSFYFNVTWVCCWHMNVELRYKINLLDFHESVHRDTTMKITNKMHCID